MSEAFILPLTYHGEELELKTRYERWGYTHRLAVLIGEDTFVFEPDEEGAYRVLTGAQHLPGDTDRELLAAIAVTLAKLQLLS